MPEAEKAVSEMATLNQEMIAGFTSMLEKPEGDHEATVAKAAKQEDDSDVMMHDITDYLVRCSTNELSDAHSAKITGMLRVVAEFEEISDCEFRLVKLMERKFQKGHALDPEVIQGLKDHTKAVSRFIDFYSERLFSPISATDIKDANNLENEIDAHRRKFNHAAMTRMQNQGDIKAEMLNIDLSNQLEKIGNHALNVMETAHEMERG